ncbi:virulence RhuM family protein [Belliella filtrata]|uniref:virulence RhuM family protein n=1 Tax=Belliella filtrata TaxID=2923435 RepID=UPI0021D41584|nr:virulence RhuM family protein [Belliella filtrata]
MIKIAWKDENSVIRNFRITAFDGKDYKVTFYSLDMVLAIGFRVRSKGGTQFRIWTNKHLNDYPIKGFLMDD